MTHGLTSLRVVVACVASLALATQLAAQRTKVADSLGLESLNQAFHFMPIVLSIDLSRGRLTDSVPDLAPIAAGSDHTVWGRFQNGDVVGVQITFRRDSGELFRKTVTKHATPEDIDVRAAGHTAEFLLRLTPKFQEAIAVLGPPDFCDRDTVVSSKSEAIFLTSLAMWQRGDVLVTYGLTVNLREPPTERREIAPRFSVGYGALRGSNTLRTPRNPTRHDTPCIVTDNEISAHAIALDSTSYESWRKKLRSSRNPDHRVQINTAPQSVSRR